MQGGGAFMRSIASFFLVGIALEWIDMYASLWGVAAVAAALAVTLFSLATRPLELLVSALPVPRVALVKTRLPGLKFRLQIRGGIAIASSDMRSSIPFRNIRTYSSWESHLTCFRFTGLSSFGTLWTRSSIPGIYFRAVAQQRFWFTYIKCNSRSWQYCSLQTLALSRLLRHPWTAGDCSFEVATPAPVAAASSSSARHFVGIVVAAAAHLPTLIETVPVHFL